ncbi:hypothetical protein SAY87_028172 [Trapa incisa]|uniref:Uncharacterized protein n=1 Tax=Trapa incisa TaxID=236973 RepID=A0AAN7KZB1_9MYRT|nr:hypothetical protein SAY87_028172 [Trapa incisa]
MYNTTARVTMQFKMTAVLGELGGRDEFFLVEGGNIRPAKEVIPPQIPEDLSTAIKCRKACAPTHIISTISYDRRRVKSLAILAFQCPPSLKGATILLGQIACAATDSIDFLRKIPWSPCILHSRHHQHCQSWERSCIKSGAGCLLIIGPRFAGAIDDTARYLKDAYGRGPTPYEYVECVKKKGIRVPEIGN